MRAEISILRDILQLAKFPSREVARAGSDYVEVLSRDLHNAAYTPPDSVIEAAEKTKAVLDEYYEASLEEKEAKQREVLRKIDEEEQDV